MSATAYGLELLSLYIDRYIYMCAILKLCHIYAINIQDGTQNPVSVCTDGDLLSLQPIKSGINHDRSRKLPATQHDI